LIKGAGNKSGMGALVERTTRLALLAWMPDATAESALTFFIAKSKPNAAPMLQTLTYNQGKKMTRHRVLACNPALGMCFRHLHRPWQRDTCENTDEVLRQWLPTGIALSVLDQQALNSTADLLKNRPRQALV